ncbi:MAG TPA: hypothetical protein ENL34_01025 [Chloroflexi bacterium]|nr:hypothetical protein [Chloroflexota bacterium]
MDAGVGRMGEDWLYVVLAGAIVLLAAAAAWVEVRVERRERPPHRGVLARDPRYRAHLERWRR